MRVYKEYRLDPRADAEDRKYIEQRAEAFEESVRRRAELRTRLRRALGRTPTTAEIDAAE